MRVAYADPPYPGCAHMYKNHPDYAGEVDHDELIKRLNRDYDGWLLHTKGTVDTLKMILPYVPDEARIMPWVKPFAAFKRNVSVAYAWEAVIVKACRKPVVTGRVVMRDWIAEGMDAPNMPTDFVAASITLKKGLTGAKPEKVCRWAFEVLGMNVDDELTDLYPGTGAVSRAWENWRNDLFRGLVDNGGKGGA